MLTLLFSLRDCFRARAVLQAEILALRHQLLVLQRSNRGHKLRLRFADRVLWVWLSRLWNGWRSALLLVKPETVIAWHREGFRLYLEMEESALQRPPTVGSGSSQSYRENELRQPPLGSSSPSWRTPETWYPGVASHGRQIHGPARQTSLPDVAILSQQSRQGLGRRRLLRGADHHVSTPLRLRDSRP